MDPSGGTDIMENFEKVVSARAGAGRSAPEAYGSLACGTEGWVTMVVGSVAPLSWMEGGVLSVIMWAWGDAGS